jgi:carbamoyltransferase
MDIAASVQEITEEVVIKLVKHAKKQYGEDTNNLVMAGGVALNCVANGKILKSNIFKNVWIQPAAGDAGGAIGAALYTWYDYLGNKRVTDEIHDSQQGSYLGISFSDLEIEEVVDTLKSGWITTGPKTKLFESQIAEFCLSCQVETANGLTC